MNLWKSGLWQIASAAALCGVLSVPAVAQTSVVDAESVSDLPPCDGPVFEPVCVNADGEAMIILRHSRRLSPVEVWGDRAEAAPGSQSVLNARAIAEVAADHPAEVLNTLPGVNIHINSGQEHLLAIRSPVLTGGAGQGSFLILENGVATRSPAFGNVNALLEPHHELAEAIEVVRGPGSAKYGSNAVHGLVNTILGGPGDGSSMRLSYGSLGRYKADLAGDQGEHWRVGLSLQKDTGWRDNTGVDQQKLSLVGDFDVGEWDVTPWVSISNLEQETGAFLQGDDAYKDADFAKTNDKPEAYRNAFSARVASRFEQYVGNTGVLRLTPYVRTQSMQFAQHFLPNGGVEKNGHTGWGLMSQYQWEPSDALTTRVGFDFDAATGFLREVQLEPFGFFPGDSRFPVGIHYDYEVETLMGALWGEADWEVSDTLTVLAGLRIEEHVYDYTTDAPVGINGRFNVAPPSEDEFVLVTPKLGALWTPGDGEVSYYANYARGERAPQASDLYRLQSLQVPGEVEEETLDSVEIGARGEALGGALYFDVAAYWMAKENFFFRDSDGLNVPDGSTEHIGIEAAGAYDLSDAWSVSGQVSWSDQTYTFDRTVSSASNTIREGGRIDSAPVWLADATLNWRGEGGAAASLSAEYVGEYTLDPAGTRTYPGHVLLNARGAYPVAEGLEAFVIVRNLLDERYADRADFAFGDERYFPGEPLNVTVGLSRDF